MSIRARTSRRKALAWFLLGSAVAAIVITQVRDEPGMTVVYRKAAERFLSGESFYVADDAMAFTYPPFFVLPYVPLAFLPEIPARAVWTWLNVCLLGGTLWMMLRMLGPEIRKGTERGGPRPWVVHLLIGLFSIRFLISPIEYQSHDLIVLGLVVLAIWAWASGAQTAAGLASGLAAACKATPLLLLPIFLWQRRFRAAAVMVLVLGAATLLPDLLAANPEKQPWVASWHQEFVSKVDVASAPEAKGAWARWNTMNQSLSGTMYRLCTPIEEDRPIYRNACLFAIEGRAFASTVLGLKLAVLAGLVWIAWPGRLAAMEPDERAFSTLGQGAAVVCAMLLLSPMTSKQHFCLLLVPLGFCLVDFFYRQRTLVVGATLFAMLGAAAGKDLLGRTLHDQLATYGFLTACTVACLVACGSIVMARSRQASRRAATSQEGGQRRLASRSKWAFPFGLGARVKELPNRSSPTPRFPD